MEKEEEEEGRKHLYFDIFMYLGKKGLFVQ